MSTSGINGSSDPGLFEIEQVQLMFSLPDIACMAVSNNILCIALKGTRIIRIDLEHPEAVDDIDLPRKSTETGVVRQIFIDPTGTHMFIATTSNENYYLNSSSTKPKPLTKLKGLFITCVGWNPSLTTRSTSEIIIGTMDGNLYETHIEPSSEYFKREDRYMKQLWKSPTGKEISAIQIIKGEGSTSRRVLVSSSGDLWGWQAALPRRTGKESMPIYNGMFEKAPLHELFERSENSGIEVTPYTVRDPPDTFGWITGVGIMHGSLGISEDSFSRLLSDAQLLLYDQLALTSEPLKDLLLTRYHIILLQGSTLTAFNRLNNQKVWSSTVDLNGNDYFIGLCADHLSSTFWAYTTQSIYEIKIVGNEERGIWRTFLEKNEFVQALSLAKDAFARDVVLNAYGEQLLKDKDFYSAAGYLGESSKPFESCALTFMDAKEFQALYKYISTKLATIDQSNTMQKTILSSWIIEIVMEKLNSLDDDLAASTDNQKAIRSDISELKSLYTAFIKDQRSVLSRSTVYEIISMHCRKDELLEYATLISDTGFVLSYWIQQENWGEALRVLVAENDAEHVYKYSTVLLVNSPRDTVESWMRISNIDAAKLVPALLAYDETHRQTADNQAIRYLKFAVNNLHSNDPAVHNTLVALYAANGEDEHSLIQYFKEQARQNFDYDFALRVCMQFERTESCVFLYSGLGMFGEAVELALRKDKADMAKVIANKSANEPPLRKSLWLDIARDVVQKSGFGAAMELTEECELLKIEDIIPLVPDFTVLDKDLKHQVIGSLESYNQHIGQLNQEMDESVGIADSIKQQLSAFEKRYALVEPGEGCSICEFPLATRRFHIFPCQHAFHSDCLLEHIKHSVDYKTKQKITEISLSHSGKDYPIGLDVILAEKCVFCSDSKIESIDAPLQQQLVESFSL